MSAVEPTAEPAVFTLAAPFVPSRTEAVVEAVREAILAGRFAPGDLLVEQDLARQFGMSKTPVREALRLLAASGLVTISTFKGASVRVVDEAMMRSVYEVRAILEPEALRRSASSGARIDTGLAEAILAEAAGAIDQADYAKLSLLNRRFHRVLYENCENPLLVQILDGLKDQTALISTVGWHARSSYTSELYEHRVILDAIAKDADPEHAAVLLRQHIERFQETVTPAVTVQSGDPRPDGD